VRSIDKKHNSILNKDEQEALEEIEKTASSLNGLVRGVTFTGGEPFLRSDFISIVEAFIEKAKISNLTIAYRIQP